MGFENYRNSLIHEILPASTQVLFILLSLCLFFSQFQNFTNFVDELR